MRPYIPVLRCILLFFQTLSGMKKDIRPSLLLLYPLSYFHLGSISFFTSFGFKNAPCACVPYIAVYSYPRRNIDWIQFFFPLYHTAFLGTSWASSSRLLFSCFLFTVLSNIVRGSASNAMCSVASSSFSFLVPHSYFLTFCAILNTLFDTVFSLCYRLTSVFFTILVLCPACCSTRNLSTVCVYRCAWAWISGEICSILRTLAVIDIFG